MMKQTITIALDGDWFETQPGARVSLERRSTLRALVQILCARRLRAPGEATSRDELVAAIWPGERLTLDSAQNRLHVAVHTLRKKGLDAALLRTGEGYLLDPEVELHLVPDHAMAA